MDVLEGNNKIDWFVVDLDAFEEAFVACLDALAEYKRYEAAYQACEDGTCDHDRRRKKDGTPDNRSSCPMGWQLYSKACDLNNGLNYYHHYDFFKKIGLIKDDENE